MDIVLTGTGSPLPDASRAGPSTLVKAGDTHLLVDAGRGVVMRLAGGGSLPGLLAGVLITHLHSDHVCALNDVITTHWVMTQGNATLQVFGPPWHRPSSSSGRWRRWSRHRLPHRSPRRTDRGPEGRGDRTRTRRHVRDRRRLGHDAGDRARSRQADARLPARTRRRGGGTRGRHDSVRGARSARRRCRRLRPDGHPPGHRRADPERDDAGHRRLPLRLSTTPPRPPAARRREAPRVDAHGAAPDTRAVPGVAWRLQPNTSTAR